MRDVPDLLTVRLAAWRARRLLRVLLVAVLLGGVVRLAAPPAAPSTTVVVAARPVNAGQVLTTDDVRTARLPQSGVPDRAPSTVDAVVGRRAAVDLPAGLTLVPAVLVDGRFDREPPRGTVVVPVTLEGSAALHLGDTVEVVADPTCAGTGEGLAATAVVVGLGVGATGEVDHGAAGLGAGIGIGTAGASADGAVLLAVTPEDGRRIAGAATFCRLGAVIVS